ncbi:MAG: 7,8-dihydroneopterin aldolase/epimerase/oxygenase [Actinomycetota bacterium]|jgi:dihydroneopterin aldolase|nr:7,8-dihydroneopterin aldolase/epimerase/oxygenase [Actinomycetota bacterium]
MNSDVIRIKDLRIPTHIGVTDEEQSRPQVVCVDVAMQVPLARAGISDDLSDTIDYDAVLREISELVRSSKSRLLEHLAEEIAQLISRHRLVERATVEITKEEFRPAGIDLGGVSVRIERIFT